MGKAIKQVVEAPAEHLESFALSKIFLLRMILAANCGNQSQKYCRFGEIECS